MSVVNTIHQGAEHNYILQLQEANTVLRRKLARLARRQQRCRCGTSQPSLLEPGERASTLCKSTTAPTPVTSTFTQAPKQHELSIVFWSTPPVPKKPSKDAPRWEERVRTLVSEIPLANTWRKAMEAKGFYNAMSTGEAVAHLLCPQNNALITSKVPAESILVASTGTKSSMIEMVRNYASLAMMSFDTASLALSLARFQKFVVLSACVVFIDLKIDKQDVYNIVRICNGRVSDEHCTRLLKTAKYMNVLIDTLATHGFDGRAAELILYWDREPNFFYHLSKSPQDSIGYFTELLSEPKFTKDAESWPRMNSFFMPSILSNVLKDRIHVAKISEMLGYQHAYLFDPTLQLVNPLQVL
ncbi:hypothetical protein LTR78_010589 [Recurvomyces mirabilis]|uniref:Uncharacterized protein n=1 Tax=Recurvomyces mirabilis TaxID=574656 RepID=A0AAE0WHX1_9PEZI|nr:hypothetical protein LTR78_010589 [Recurvomyces mirabilis]KAK5150133.1 hypothetical protein LTS14_010396 [Recurvomyces mirabilis]